VSNALSDHVSMRFSCLNIRMPWFTDFGRLGFLEFCGGTGTDDERSFLLDNLMLQMTSERPFLAIDHPRRPGFYEPLLAHYRMRIEIGLVKEKVLELFRVVPADVDAVVDAFFGWWQNKLAPFIPADDRVSFQQLSPTHDRVIYALETCFHPWLKREMETSEHTKQLRSLALAA